MKKYRGKIIAASVVAAWVAYFFYFLGATLGYADEGLIHPEVGFLVLAPDRGFLGNEEVRELVGRFSKEYTAALSFATDEQTLGNIQSGIDALKAQNVEQIWVLPLFISPENVLYQRAAEALNAQRWGLPVRMGETMNESYLTEEILKDRIKTLSKGASQEVLFVLGYGAGDEKSAGAMQEDLEALVARVNRSFHFRSTEVRVLYDWGADEKLGDLAFDETVERIVLNRAKGERVLVIPFNFGKKMTHMMAAWSWVKGSLSKYDKISANGLGVLPHKNVGFWFRKEANRRLPLRDDEIGVVLMPHGADFNWNETIRKNLSPLLKRYKIEYAFSMADPKVMDKAVKKLEARGARAITVVRIFSLAASFREKTEYILGLNHHYRRGGHTMRIASPALLSTVGGTERDPLLAQVLLERAKELSKDPEKETVILLAHGTDSEERNQHWMENLAALADEMRENGGSKFRKIQYHTWREDWADKREIAIKRIRRMIEEANNDGGIAIIVPERTAGRGGGEKYFEGLSYRYATGFSPHPNFTRWIEKQIEAGKKILRAEILGTLSHSPVHPSDQAKLETK